MSQPTPSPDGTQPEVPQPPYGGPPAYGAQQPYGQQPPAQQPYGQQQPYAAQPYPQQAYPQQAYPGVPAQPTNTLAIVALISGIAGFTFVPLLGSIVAIITGHMAKRQVAETGEQGRGMAVAGLVMGYAVVGLGLALLVFGVLAAVLFSTSSSS